jgi:hypothetical protein
VAGPVYEFSGFRLDCGRFEIFLRPPQHPPRTKTHGVANSPGRTPRGIRALKSPSAFGRGKSLRRLSRKKRDQYPDGNVTAPQERLIVAQDEILGRTDYIRRFLAVGNLVVLARMLSRRPGNLASRSSLRNRFIRIVPWPSDAITPFSRKIRK